MLDRPPADRPVVAIALMVAAVALLSIMDACIKQAAKDFSTVQIIFFRLTVGFVPIGIYLTSAGGIGQLRTRRIGAHALRAAMGLAAMGGFFYAFAVLPLADVVAIGFAAPILVTALSVVLLGDKVGPRRWAAVVVGFAGVALMIRPGGEVGWGGAITFAATICYALVIVFVRGLSRTETSGAIVFYYTLFATLAASAAVPFVWRAPDLHGLVLLIAIGLLGGTGQILVTRSLALAPPAVVVPFDYTAMLWAAGLGWVFFDELPEAWTWAGAALVTASGLYILHRETVKARETM
ncbi:MAG: DMT family transporter [Alphaproteobacteria bacterium]|nr:DMT family transporter [Alphaproteobacteria bacterium]